MKWCQRRLCVNFSNLFDFLQANCLPKPLWTSFLVWLWRVWLTPVVISSSGLRMKTVLAWRVASLSIYRSIFTVENSGERERGSFEQTKEKLPGPSQLAKEKNLLLVKRVLWFSGLLADQCVKQKAGLGGP